MTSHPVTDAKTAGRTNCEHSQKLKAAFPKQHITLTDTEKKKSRVHPRITLMRSIEDSVKYLNDNSYRVRTSKGEERKPTLFYSIDSGVAEVRLTYMRSAIYIDGNNTLECPAAILGDVLNFLHESASNGAFDDQLETIRDRRLESMRSGRSTDKKKK